MDFFSDNFVLWLARGDRIPGDWLVLSFSGKLARKRRRLFATVVWIEVQIMCDLISYDRFSIVCHLYFICGDEVSVEAVEIRSASVLLWHQGR